MIFANVGFDHQTGIPALWRQHGKRAARSKHKIANAIHINDDAVFANEIDNSAQFRDHLYRLPFPVGLAAMLAASDRFPACCA